MHIYATTSLFHWTLSINQDLDVMCHQDPRLVKLGHLHLPLLWNIVTAAGQVTAHSFIIAQMKIILLFYLCCFALFIYAHILAASPSHIDRFPLFRGWSAKINGFHLLQNQFLLLVDFRSLWFLVLAVFSRRQSLFFSPELFTSIWGRAPLKSIWLIIYIHRALYMPRI